MATKDNRYIGQPNPNKAFPQPRKVSVETLPPNINDTRKMNAKSHTATKPTLGQRNTGGNQKGAIAPSDKLGGEYIEKRPVRVATIQESPLDWFRPKPATGIVRGDAIAYQITQDGIMLFHVKDGQIVSKSIKDSHETLSKKLDDLKQQYTALQKQRSELRHNPKSLAVDLARQYAADKGIWTIRAIGALGTEVPIDHNPDSNRYTNMLNGNAGNTPSAAPKSMADYAAQSMSNPMDRIINRSRRPVGDSNRVGPTTSPTPVAPPSQTAPTNSTNPSDFTRGERPSDTSGIPPRGRGKDDFRGSSLSQPTSVAHNGYEERKAAALKDLLKDLQNRKQEEIPSYQDTNQDKILMASNPKKYTANVLAHMTDFQKKAALKDLLKDLQNRKQEEIPSYQYTNQDKILMASNPKKYTANVLAHMTNFQKEQAVRKVHMSGNGVRENYPDTNVKTGDKPFRDAKIGSNLDQIYDLKNPEMLGLNLDFPEFRHIDVKKVNENANKEMDKLLNRTFSDLGLSETYKGFKNQQTSPTKKMVDPDAVANKTTSNKYKKNNYTSTALQKENTLPRERGQWVGEDKWIQKTHVDAPGHKGKLHADLGISQDKKIPHSDLVKASHSKNPKTRKRAQFALNVAK